MYGFVKSIAKDHFMSIVKINWSLKSQIPKKFNPLDTGNVKIALKTLPNASAAKRREQF